MKFVVQRVKKAAVKVDHQVVGKINSGMMVLIGFKIGDDFSVFDRSIEKLLNLRIFQDENGLMNLSLNDAKKEILVVSQFTLYGDASKGNRPSFIHSLAKEKAQIFYDEWMKRLKVILPQAQSGTFSADMEIEMCADGPVTILMEF